MRKSIFGVIMGVKFRIESKSGKAWVSSRWALVSSSRRNQEVRVIEASKNIETLVIELKKSKKENTININAIEQLENELQQQAIQEADNYALYPSSDIYCISASRSDLLEFLNKLGNEGWETSGRLSPGRLENAILMRKRIS